MVVRLKDLRDKKDEPRKIVTLADLRGERKPEYLATDEIDARINKGKAEQVAPNSPFLKSGFHMMTPMETIAEGSPLTKQLQQMAAEQKIAKINDPLHSLAAGVLTGVKSGYKRVEGGLSGFVNGLFGRDNSGNYTEGRVSPMQSLGEGFTNPDQASKAYDKLKADAAPITAPILNSGLSGFGLNDRTGTAGRVASDLLFDTARDPLTYVPLPLGGIAKGAIGAVKGTGRLIKGAAEKSAGELAAAVVKPAVGDLTRLKKPAVTGATKATDSPGPEIKAFIDAEDAYLSAPLEHEGNDALRGDMYRKWDAVVKKHGGEEQAQEALTTAKIDSAPKMEQGWFTNLFGNQGVGISAFNSTKRISKDPLTTSDQIVKSGIKNDIQGVKDTVAARSRAAYQNFVDRLAPLKRIGDQTYDTAMDASRANNIANTIVRDKFVTPEGQVVGEGLQNIFKKVARGQDKPFMDYLVLRHATTRMDRGERVYAENLAMTPEKVQQRLTTYEQRYPGFKDIAKEWDGFNENVLKTYGVDEGLISPEAFNHLREKNPNYAPMRRQFSRSEKPGRSFLAKTTSSSFSGQKAPIKEVSPTGSVRNIIDPRKTTIESVGAWANAAMRNRVMQSMVDAVKSNPEAFNGVAEIVQKPKGKSNLADILHNEGQDSFLELLDGEFNNLFKKTSLDQDNIVRAMVKGQPVYLQVHDPELVKTLIGMGPQASNLLIDAMSVASNATKRGATGLLAPVFAVKGATMDLIQSAIQADNPAKQAAYTVYGILSGIGDKLRIPGLKNLAEEYRRAGGEYSAALKGDRKLNTQISSMTRDPILSPKGIAKGTGKLIGLPFKVLGGVGDIAENAPRMAAYKLKLNQLGGERTTENVRQAISAGREATVNFSRKGALSRDIEAFVPYNNAAVQGTYRVMKAFKQNPVRTTAAIGMLAVVPKLYEYAQFHDDPDYQKLPARERYRFLIVNKNADGTFTKFPMEPAYNSIGELTIEALRSLKDKDPNAFKGMWDALANTWLPPIATGAAQGLTQGSGLEGIFQGAGNATVFAPASAVISNKSFTGAPIVPQRLQGNSPGQQYDERTSDPAKWMGQKLGMSPMKVDYLIRSYGGDLSRLVLPLMSDVGGGTPRNTLLKNFIADPVFTNTLSNDFYNMKQRITQAENDNKDKGVDLPTWYDTNTADYVTTQKKGSITKQLSELSGEKRDIQADKTLSSQQKADKLREVQAKINGIYLDAVTTMQKGGVPKK